MDHNTWVSRETRASTFYHHYYSYPAPVVFYNDPYSHLFWLWMLDRSLDERARWAYHHRSEMDNARYQAMLTKDAKLEARIKQLEAEKLAHDPGYTPNGMTDPDLQYTDEYVDSVYNPESTPGVGFWVGLWTVIKWVFFVALIVGLIWLLVWVFFYKEWE
jgi:hypothetical protein